MGGERSGKDRATQSAFVRGLIFPTSKEGKGMEWTGQEGRGWDRIGKGNTERPRIVPGATAHSARQGNRL